MSIFDPAALGTLLAMPGGAEPRAQPELDHWTLGRPVSKFVSENGWTVPAPA